MFVRVSRGDFIHEGHEGREGCCLNCDFCDYGMDRIVRGCPRLVGGSVGNFLSTAQIHRLSV